LANSQRKSASAAVAHTRCAAATIIDTVGSAAIATVSDKAGVSVHISADYLSGLEVGETMAIDAEVINLGKRLATVEVRAGRERLLIRVRS